MSRSLTDQLNDILDDIKGNADEVIDKAAKKAASNARKKLREVSPQNKGGYHKGWSVKKVSARDYIVYNSKYPGLTHLLENGHAGCNKYGQWGRVKPIKHIQPVEQDENEEFYDDVINGLNKNL